MFHLRESSEKRDFRHDCFVWIILKKTTRKRVYKPSLKWNKTVQPQSVLNDIFISGTALLNKCEPFKVCLDTQLTQLIRPRDAETKNFNGSKYDSLCS